jgi:hypothetical protein
VAAKPILRMLGRLEGRFGVLFVTLLAALVVPGFLPSGTVARLFLNIFFSFVLVAGLVAVSDNRLHLTAGLVLVIPAIAINWLGKATDSVSLGLLSSGIGSAFLAFLAVVMILFAARSRRVTLNVLFAAVSAYLLMGLAWAEWYALIEVISPGAISFDLEPGLAGYEAHVALLNESVYYSIVTMTTLGYGDMAPIAPQARALAMMQALIGQLYLVVMIARLVALNISHEGKE